MFYPSGQETFLIDIVEVGPHQQHMACNDVTTSWQYLRRLFLDKVLCPVFSLVHLGIITLQRHFTRHLNFHTSSYGTTKLFVITFL